MKQRGDTTDYWLRYWSSAKDVFSSNPSESGSRYPRAFSEWIHEVEVKTVFERSRPGPDDAVADFGAGGGRFSLAFAPFVKRVYAVEHSDLYAVLVANAAPFGNIVCLKNSIQEAVIPEPCSIAVISGVLMYSTDAAAENILGKAAESLTRNGVLVLREPLRPGGMVNVNRKLYRPKDAYVIREDQHFEFYRDPAWYVEVAGRHGLRPTGGCISHAPVFYFLPGWFPFKTRIHSFMAGFLADKRHSGALVRYNRVLRGPYGFLRHLLRKKSMRFLFFQKAGG